MHDVFSTAELPPDLRYRRWRSVLTESFVPSEQTLLTEKPFKGSLRMAAVGPLGVAQVDLDAMRSKSTAATIRQHGKHHLLAVVIVLRGSNIAEQDGRESIQRSGELTILDSNRPASIVCEDGTSTYFLEVPRAPFETMLGSARLFSSLTIGGSSGGAALAVNFITDLIAREGGLNPATRERMGSIAIDLMIAAAAERMAREPSREIYAESIVQRAKLHIESFCSDAGLDPPQVAIAAGVSLRRLQQLFHERGVHLSDWIWERRLQKAAKMLSDPASFHLTIAHVAYVCGFSAQAHFSSRFRRRFGLTPRDYRQQRIERIHAGEG